MTYTKQMILAERQALLEGETRGEWYQYMTSTGVGVLEQEDEE